MILTRLIERECIYSSRDPVIVAVKNLFEEQQVSSSYTRTWGTLNFINIVLLLITNYLLEAKFTAVRILARAAFEFPTRTLFNTRMRTTT